MLSRSNMHVLQEPNVSSKKDERQKVSTPEQSEKNDDRGEHGYHSPALLEVQKTIEELKQTLDTARADLARKKGELKDFEQLFVGTLKGLVHGERKANIQKEYDDFLKKYQEARAAYVVADVGKLTEERLALMDALVEAKGKGEEHFLVKGYKWLGDQNISRLFGEKFGWNISDAFQKDHPLVTGSLRIAGKFLSVRTAISLGLLGAGLMTGVGSGLALGLGILGARAAMRGIGTASGAHDMLKLVGAETWESKGTFKYKKEEPWFKKIALWEKMTPQEIAKLGKDQIEERLANMEANALLHGKKVGESEIYRQFLSEYENKLKQEGEKNGEDAMTVIQKLSEASDAKRDTLAREKRIKHQTIVGVLTVAMVVVPGIHQFQRVLDKNAVEWAAVTKQAGEVSVRARDVVFGEPAYGATPETAILRDLHVVEGLQNKATYFAAEMSNHEKPDHQLSIEDVRHIRNIASRVTQDGVNAKKLLQYIEKRNLIEQSNIHTVILGGDHATVYGALENAARKYPEYFKDVSVDQRASEIARQYGLTIDQLKTLPHVGEELYFSKDGVIVTQHEALVEQMSVAHKTIIEETGPRTAFVHETQPKSAPPVEHHGARTIHRQVHHPRQSEDIRLTQKGKEIGPVQSHEPMGRGEMVTEEKKSTGSVVFEKTHIHGSDVHTETTRPKIELQPESEHKLEMRVGQMGDTHEILPAEIFARGYDQAHIAEFLATARENPDDFLTFYRAAAGYDLYRYEPRCTLYDIRTAIADPKMGEANIKTLMEIAHNHTKPFKLTIGGVHKEFLVSTQAKESSSGILSTKELKGQKTMIEIAEAPAEKTPTHELMPKQKIEIPAESTTTEHGKAPETPRLAAVEASGPIPGDRIPVSMGNFYGGTITGSVQFFYDSHHQPIGFSKDLRIYGTQTPHGMMMSDELKNKFFYHNLGDKQHVVSEQMATRGKRIDMSVLQTLLERYNKMLAFDLRLREDLLAHGHKAEAKIVLEDARRFLQGVQNEYGMDEYLVHKENFPPELK